MLDEVALANTLSPTQVDTYRLCPRKWAWNKRDKIKKPSNRFAQRGTDAHDVLDAWLARGEPPDLSTEIGKMVQPGLKLLPAPMSGESEHEFRLTTEVGIYVMKLDHFKLEREADKILVDITDHKTTTDFKWMKSPDDLMQDVQACSYGIAGFKKVAIRAQAEGWEDMRPVVLRKSWVYYRAGAEGKEGSKPAARKVQLVVLPEGMPVPKKPDDVQAEHFGFMRTPELLKTFDGIEATAAEMLDHHRAGRMAMDLPYNAGACEAYGGCPYRDDPCILTGREKMRGIMAQEEKSTSLFDKAKAAALALKGNGAAAKSASSEASDGAKNAAAAEVAKAAGGTSDVDQALAKIRASKGLAPSGNAPETSSASTADGPRVNPPEEPALDSPDPDPNAGTEAAAAPADGKKRGRPKGATAAVVPAGAGITAVQMFAAQLVRAGVYHVDDKDYAKKIAAKARELAKELEE